jgi:hypothetical protein
LVDAIVYMRDLSEILLRERLVYATGRFVQKASKTRT